MKRNNSGALLFICCLMLIFSCSNKVTKGVTSENLKEGYTKGIITSEYAEKGCDFLIKATVKDQELVYSAINLDESLKKNGKEFQFKFRPIRSPRKGDCKTGIYIYIEEFE